MVALSQCLECIPINVHPTSDRQPLQISTPSEDLVQHSSHLQCSLSLTTLLSPYQWPPISDCLVYPSLSMAASPLSAYQSLCQPINGCLIYLSLSVAISAYQWLSHLSQPINGCLIYLSLSVAISSISAYQWLSQPIRGCLISLSLSVVVSAYQWQSQPINGNLSLSAAISAYQWLYWLYLSLSVAALVSQSRYQSISGWLIYLSAYQWLPPFTLGGTVGCCLIRGRGWSMQP